MATAKNFLGHRIYVMRTGKRAFHISGPRDKLDRAVARLKPEDIDWDYGHKQAYIVLPEYTMATAPNGLGWGRITEQQLADYIARC